MPRAVDRNASRLAYESAWLVCDSLYLRSRGVRPATLTAPRFLGTFRADSRGRVLFPHHDDAGFARFESKGYGWTSFASGGVKAMWSSNSVPTDTRVVLAESAIDALSHYQLHPDARTRYASGEDLARQIRELAPGPFERAISPIGKDWNDCLKVRERAFIEGTSRRSGTCLSR